MKRRPNRAQVAGAGGSQTVAVSLRNPFRPQDPSNSGGLGYDAYGYGGPVRDNIRSGGGSITISVAYPGGCHVAVNKDSVALGYSR